ncbi:MAG: iron-containing alcohol dehydrogenase, partial [Ignavibacteriaceae bacterium]
LSIASVGVTIPHGIGMAISGLYPHIAHGASLAINYPACTRFTYEYAVPQFAKLGRMLDPQLTSGSDDTAAEKSCDLLDDFLKKIDLWIRLKDFDMPENEIPLLAKNSMILPDYENNPRVATAEEMLEIIQQSYSL